MIDKGRAGYIERCTSGSWRGFDRDRPRKRIWRGRAYLMSFSRTGLNGHWLEVVTESLDRVAEGREGVSRFDFSPCTGELGYGADFHPSRARAVRMADELIPYLQSIL